VPFNVFDEAIVVRNPPYTHDSDDSDEEDDAPQEFVVTDVVPWAMIGLQHITSVKSSIRQLTKLWAFCLDVIMEEKVCLCPQYGVMDLYSLPNYLVVRLRGAMMAFPSEFSSMSYHLVRCIYKRRLNMDPTPFAQAEIARLTRSSEHSRLRRSTLSLPY
jgi:hypothetical protein